MKNYESYDDKWKELIGAAARLLTNLAGMAWYVGAALVAMMILHSVLSEPFEFTCKGRQIEGQVQPSKHRNMPVQLMPIVPADTKADAPARIVEPKHPSQE